MQILQTFVKESEIIGVSPVYRNDSSQISFNFSFDVYTKANMIPIKTNNLFMASDTERKEAYQAIVAAHKQVVELLTEKEPV